MSLKKSVMISDSSLSFIAQRSLGSTSDIRWSQTVNAAFSDLQMLVTLSMPALDANDWLIILDAHNGTSTETSVFPLRLASDVLDHYGVIDIADLAPEIQSTVRKLYSLTQCEQYAVLDVVRRFWIKDWQGFDGSLADQIDWLCTNTQA